MVLSSWTAEQEPKSSAPVIALNVRRELTELPPQDHFVKVRGITLRYVDWGDNGPLLLLLHGAMRTSRSWDAVARSLRPHHHVISLDARGHGDSEWTARGYRFSNRVEDVSAFCDLMGLDVGREDVTVVGHSNGAVVLAMLAKRRPELFSRLVLLEPMLFVEAPGEVPPRPSNRPRRTWSSREELHAYLKQHRAAGRWREDVILDVVNHETMELPDGRIDMKWSSDTVNLEERQGEYFDLRPFFQNAGLPIQFIVSGERTQRFRDVQDLPARVPSFHFTRVQDTGHNMYMERPDAVASLIRAFVGGGEIPGVV